MNSAPNPAVKAFLICDKVVVENGRTSILKLADVVASRFFPAAHLLGVFARLGSAHGDYQMEVQLQTLDEKVVWRGGPRDKMPMQDPLMDYNLNLNLNIVFPEAGIYDLVLLANDKEIARQKFKARAVPQPSER